MREPGFGLWRAIPGTAHGKWDILAPGTASVAWEHSGVCHNENVGNGNIADQTAKVEDQNLDARTPGGRGPARGSIRLIATDIDGTLLNPQFQISKDDLASLRRAHAAGIEVVLVTGRRHRFALPIAQQLGFDLWVISSNGAVTRSLTGEKFHRDLLPVETCRELCGAMLEFRGNTVLTFDQETRGAIVLERLDELNESIQRWLEKNMEFIEFVVPIEKALVSDPVQAMFCGSMERMGQALRTIEGAGMNDRITVLRTEYPERNLSMIDVLNAGCSKGHALERWAAYRGISREQVMAIGDNHNDVEMLEFAGHPVIMGNACAELRGRGWTVTLGNGECGVAAAVEAVIGGQ
jgi:Cof subfamily protein (haloacid dehalogenase superfamily)